MLGGLDLEALIPGRNNEPPPEKTWAEQAEEEVCALLPSLTFQQRLIGCVSCMSLGYLLSFGSFFRFRDLVLGNPYPFVLVSTVGNFISLSGSCFLTGPTSQVKKMFHKSRKIATILYIGSMSLTLVVAVTMKHVRFQGLLLVILLVCQYAAVAWYCLSYIPFARDAVKRCCSRTLSGWMDDE